MAISSAQIAQAMAAQNSMFSGQVSLSRQLSYPGGFPGMSNADGGYGQMAQNMTMGAAGFMGNVAMPFAGGAASLAGGLGMLGSAGRFLEPFSMMMRGGAAGYGMMGGGMAGMGGAALGAAAGFLPFFAAGTALSAYSGAVTGGMQDQMGVNSMLGGNFNFSGGSGAGGRGFNQGQMGRIGGAMSQMARQDPFVGMGELTGLAGAGSQMGMFTAVRDVREFTKKFREMIGTLKTVQDELGGSLQEALQFVQQAKSSGIFKASDRAMFSGVVRRTSDISGLSQQNVMRMTSFGSQLARSLGGTGAQGAVGASVALQQVGAAVQGGILNEELLSEATGGLTGDAAMMAFSQRMMQRAGKATRGGFGRFSIYALANDEGTGIDSGKMARFLSGDMSLSEISRAAHENVRRMGRPKAMRNEGLLRASALQQGGLAFQAGKMRAMLGDRVMMADDDTLQAVIQRRFRMNRAEATAMTSMIRNLPEISTRMAIDSEQSDSAQRRRDFQQENQSFDSLKRRLSMAIQEGLGVADAREWGRKLFSDVGSGVDKFVNDLFGIARQEFNQTGRDRMRRVMMGQGTSADFEAIASAEASMGSTFSGAAQLRGGILQSGPTEGGYMQAMGFDVKAMSGPEGRRAYLRALSVINQANEGTVSGSNVAKLEALNKNPSVALDVISKAVTQGDGDKVKTAQSIQDQGYDPVVMAAFAYQRGIPLGQEGKLSGTMQSGNSGMGGVLDVLSFAAGSIGLDVRGVRGKLALKAFGFDYSGVAGGAQELEDSLGWVGGRGIEEDDIQAAFSGNEKLRAAAQIFVNSSGEKGLDELKQAALTLKGPQRKAALAIISRVSGATGEEADKLMSALGRVASVPGDSANARMTVQEMAKLRVEYGGIASRIGEGPVADSFQKMADGGDLTGIRDTLYQLVDMDPEQRSEILSKMGDSAAAVAFRQGALSASRQTRAMVGGGRRSRNAMHAMLSGGLSDGLDITLGSGRRLSSRESRSLLDRGLRGGGGKAGEKALSSYRSSLMDDLGASPELAGQVVQMQREAMVDGRIDKGEVRMFQEFSRSSGLGKLITERNKKAQQARDPLSRDRNDALVKIVTNGDESLKVLRQIEKGLIKERIRWDPFAPDDPTEKLAK